MTNVRSPTAGASAGAALSNDCGLIASSSVAGGDSPAGTDFSSLTPSGAAVAKGSTTDTSDAGSPSASHPRSIALPMLQKPHNQLRPTPTNGPEVLSGDRKSPRLKST